MVARGGIEPPTRGFSVRMAMAQQLTLRGLPKRAFECLYGLASLYQVPVIQNHGWHRVNAGILIKLLARPNLSRVLVGIEYLTGALAVQSNTRCNVLEHLEVA